MPYNARTMHFVASVLIKLPTDYTSLLVLNDKMGWQPGHLSNIHLLSNRRGDERLWVLENVDTTRGRAGAHPH